MASRSSNSEGTEPCREVEASAVDWVRRTDQVDTFLSTLDRHLQRRRRRRWTQAAGAAAVLVLGGVLWMSMAPVRSPRAAPVAALVQGAGAKQVLVDGSEVDLGAGADVAVAFTAEIRQVALQRGRAFFRVAKSPVPFVVRAGGVEVRAVGTAFTTQLTESGEVEVVVTEGIVAIDRPARSPRGREPAASGRGPGRSERTVALLEAGKRLVIPVGVLDEGLESRIVALDAAEMAQRLDWRAPQLRFDGTPLAEAAPLFNRHSRIQLRLADEAVGRVKLSGALPADNVAPLIRMLELEYGLKAVREGDVITIGGAADPGR